MWSFGQRSGTRWFSLFIFLLPLTADFGATPPVKTSAAGIHLPGPCLNYSIRCWNNILSLFWFGVLQGWFFLHSRWRLEHLVQRPEGGVFLNSELIQSCNKDQDYFPRPFTFWIYRNTFIWMWVVLCAQENNFNWPPCVFSISWYVLNSFYSSWLHKNLWSIVYIFHSSIC